MRNSISRPARSRGFTLLELVVVILIIGITISFVTLSGGPRRGTLDNEARRLAALLQLAADEAVMSAREYAADFTETGYRFVEYKDGSWQKLSSSSDEILLPHTLPDGFRFKLNLAGEEVDFGKFVLDEDEKNKTPTGIFLLSSGDITPFEITIIDRCSGKNRILSNLEDGCIRLISGQSSLAATNR